MPVAWEAYIDVPTDNNEAAIMRLEQELGVALPEDVRGIIRDRAGQVTQPEVIDIDGRGDASFGPILYAGGKQNDANYSYSVEYAISTISGWAGSENNAALKLFPFASDSAVGYFCMDYRDGQSTPAIVLVDLDYDFDEEKAVKTAAPHLTGLLERLR